MLGVVIPTLNAAEDLGDTIGPLRGELIVVSDGGSDDDTRARAQRLGAHVIGTPRGRGTQLNTGAARAIALGAEWLMFLHADTRLHPGWRIDFDGFVARRDSHRRAACFRLQFDDGCAGARRAERWVARRIRWLGLPYGDQGLIVHRDFYEAAGGFRDLPLMEDVDLVRRLGRGNIVALGTPAVTSAVRYRKAGYRIRGMRNLLLLSLYFLGVSPGMLARLYD